MAEERYTRQARLAEVGNDGQVKIQAHDARICAGPDAGIALSYLVRAGVGSACISHFERPDFPHRGWFAFDGCLSVAQGAHQALLQLKRALKTDGAGS